MKEAVRTAGRDERGAALVEFALVFPLLVLLIFGIFEFAMTMNTVITLTYAANTGAFQFSNSGGVGVGGSQQLTTPYSLAVAAAEQAAAPVLTPSGGLTVSVLYNGTPCGATAQDTTPAQVTAANNLCFTDLSGNKGIVTVTATYPCTWLAMLYNLMNNGAAAAGCLLSAQTEEPNE